MNRLLTGVGLLAVAFFLIFIATPWVFALAAVLMSVLCYREFATLVAAHGIARPGWLGIATGLSLLFWPQITQFILNPIAVITCLLAGMLIVALGRDNLNEILPQAACEFFGAFYTFAPWRFSIDLRRESVHFLFFTLALSWVGDTAAYYVGRAWGRHKLAPIVSPGKSWEGAIASVLASVVFGLAYLSFFFPVLPWWKITLVGLLGNVAGQLGDLAESAIKRGAGLKDSGNLLPGHGGILDRVDSNLFALPVVFTIYLLLLKT
jgi:phosphatidate cytidylyltransferase